MNEYLTQLIELSKIDKSIDSYEPKIEAIRATLDAQLQKEQEIQAQIQSNNELLESNELTIARNEQHLKELAEKLKELSKKSAAVKTEKEMKALQLEEEIAKEQIDFANEEIERLEKIKEQKLAENEELQAKIEQMQAETEEIKAQTEKEMAELEKDRMQVYEKRQALMSKMNQNIIVFYEKIRRWAKNTTVVPVKKQACYGCFMRLNDHTYASVISGEEITTCPHCGRILYIEREEAKEESEQEASA